MTTQADVDAYWAAVQAAKARVQTQQELAIVKAMRDPEEKEDEARKNTTT